LGTAWELDETHWEQKNRNPEAIPKSNSIVIDINLGPCWVRETKTTPMNQQQEPRTGQH
jgi:hypothetical protein